MNEATSPPATASTALRQNSLGLRHAIIISVAVMSPAASIFFNTIPQAGLVGAMIPLCYVIGFVIALFVANAYSEFSREIPSSGSSYTFVTESLGVHMGFLSAWMGIMAVAVGVPYSFILLSANLQILIHRWFSLNLHWSFWFVLMMGIAFAICYWGIRQSMNIDLTFLAFEIGICLVLAVIVLFHAGQNGTLSTAPFSLSSLPPQGSLIGGIILGVLSYIGFETAASLGSETKNPHSAIPRAIFGSMLVVGLFYTLMAYVGTIGYGIQNMVTGFANDPAPFDTISRQLAGPWFTILIDLVGLFSFFSAAIAIINGSSRIIYTVGREGLLPRWSTYLHPHHHTPIGAITALCLFGMVVGISLGFIMTPIGAFGFLGTLDALFVLFIYALVCLGCFTFFWRKRRTLFKLLRHAVLPLLGTLLITVIFLLVFITPEAPPLNLIPYIILIWLALGIGLLFIIHKKIALINTSKQ